jgi:hypothetical protein
MKFSWRNLNASAAPVATSNRSGGLSPHFLQRRLIRFIGLKMATGMPYKERR